MKLWLLKQDVNTGYDTYDSCVVAAETEEAARRIHPSMWVQQDWWVEEAESKTNWNLRDWTSPEQVEVGLLGEASEDLEAGVVCSSFNAG